MSATPGAPRSRTPSRAALPARLAIPHVLRPTHSLTNLHAQGEGSPSGLSNPLPFDTTPQVLDSSASSVANVDLSGGIILQDVDAEVDIVDVENGNVMGHMDNAAGADESKKTLRDQLRRTLSRKQLNSEKTNKIYMIHLVPKGRGELSIYRRCVTIPPVDVKAAPRYPPREYFVLTDAGKPVFTSRPEGADDDNMTSMIGIMQALISVFIDDNDRIRCINAGNTRITFLLRSPLYYVCASSWGEPESVTRSHLEYLHLQILSVVTATQLQRIFERRTNFDLRRLLNGAETFLTSMLDRLEFDLALCTSSLHCVKLDHNLRKRAADALVAGTKMKDILYIILIACGRIVTLARPRKHSIHPADIHILLNTIHAPSVLNSLATASYIPVCLPKFNPAGFVNAYISFLRKDDGLTPLADSLERRRTLCEADGPTLNVGYEADSEIVLVCISGGIEFETIRGWCDGITKQLEGDGVLDGITAAFRTGLTDYTVSELGIPGLRHFLYKSRVQVQVTLPTFDDPYHDTTERRRLITLYQILHDAIHAKSGQQRTLKLQYIRTEKESVMGWITQPFELYIALSPMLPKSAAVNAANAVARWVKKEEGKLFLKDAPVF